MVYYKMFGFIKKCFYKNDFFSCNVLNMNPLKCVSMDNLGCKVGSKIINVKSNELLF